jgi:tetratricopeptide (TPR) repeat protein
VESSTKPRPDSTEVSAALERILCSVSFTRSFRLASFLRFIVNERLAGRGQSTKEYALGVNVFNRGPDYDPRIDPIVRVQARQLRFKLLEYYETVGREDPIRIEMPKGSYLLEIGFAAEEPLLEARAAPAPAAEIRIPDPVAVAPALRKPAMRRTLAAALLVTAAVLGVVFVLFVRSGGSGGKAAGRPRARVVNPGAQDLYLKGRYYWNKRTPESLKQALDFFNQAIGKDPGYTTAYVGLADCYNLLREYTAMPPGEAWPRAIMAAKKAVELDDSSAEAHSSLAFALFYGALDTRNGEREFRRAIELNPACEKAHHWYATSLMSMGRSQEALAEIERARELDPASTSVLADKGYILFYRGQPDQAIALLRQVEAAEPASQSAHAYLARIYLNQSDSANYLLELQRTAELSQNAQALAISAAARKGFAAGGPRGMLESILLVQENLLKEGRWSHYDVATICAVMGRRPDALDHLQSALENREMEILALGNDPAFASLRSEPRFQELEKKVRLSLGS